MYAAVTWLATTYWLAKTGQVACKDLDLSCREQSSFFYRATDIVAPVDHYLQHTRGKKRYVPMGTLGRLYVAYGHER